MDYLGIHRKSLRFSLNKSKRIRIAIVFIIITFFIIICFDLLFSGYFIWDDKTFLFDEIITRVSWKSLSTNGHYGLYHPVTTSFIRLSYLLFNNESIYLHALNLFIHIVNSLLFLKILHHFKVNFKIIIFVFALFLFHPHNIETYAWLTSIKDLLASFFVLSAVYYYLKFREHILKGYNRHSIILIILTIAALLAKPTTVYLPFAIYLIEAGFQKRYFHKANLHLLYVLIPVATFVVFYNYYIRVSISIVFMLAEFSFHERMLIAGINIIEYSLSSLALRPPSIFYPYPFEPGASSTYSIYLIPLPLLSIPYFALSRNSRFNYTLLLGIGLLLLLPILQLIPIGESVRNDRYMYLFIAYMLFMVAMIIPRVIDKISKQNKWLLLLLLVALLSLTIIRYFDRIKDWNDQKELFIADFSRHSNSEVLANTLGVLYMNSGNQEKAIEYLEKAIHLDGKYAKAYTNLGKAYRKRGEPEKAIPFFIKSTLLIPFQFEAYHELSATYYTQGNYRQADSVLNVGFDRNDDQSLNLLGKIKYQLGEVDTSIELHTGALKIRRSEYYLYDLAISYGKTGNFNKSLELINEALTLNNKFAEAYYLKGVILAQKGEEPCSNFHKALSLGYEEARDMIQRFCL
jgi:tetratricopeptide (TPR) repeat protein